MTHIRPLQFGEFADVVYNGQRGELGLDQTIATIVEALEAIVVLKPPYWRFFCALPARCRCRIS